MKESDRELMGLENLLFHTAGSLSKIKLIILPKKSWNKILLPDYI